MSSTEGLSERPNVGGVSVGPLSSTLFFRTPPIFLSPTMNSLDSSFEPSFLEKSDILGLQPSTSQSCPACTLRRSQAFESCRYLKSAEVFERAGLVMIDLEGRNGAPFGKYA